MIFWESLGNILGNQVFWAVLPYFTLWTDGACQGMTQLLPPPVFADRSAYLAAYPGAYPCLSQVTDVISMVYGSTGVPAPGLSNARNASASGPVAPAIFSYQMCLHLCSPVARQ